MRKLLLGILLTIIALQAPWRLAALFVETLLVTPGWARMDSGQEQYWATRDLQVRLDARGWTVNYESNLALDSSPAYGTTDRATRTIAIDASLSWNARRLVIAHEAGHILQPAWLNHNQAEAFAGAVAGLVSHQTRESARYLSKFRADSLLVMIVEWRAIYRAAAVWEVA